MISTSKLIGAREDSFLLYIRRRFLWRCAFNPRNCFLGLGGDTAYLRDLLLSGAPVILPPGPWLRRVGPRTVVRTACLSSRLGINAVSPCREGFLSP